MILNHANGMATLSWQSAVMATKPNFYVVLGVSAACDDVVIHAAYRALMLKHHPDKNQNPNSTYRSASINEAFQVLRDSSSRKLYDLSLNNDNKEFSPCCNCNFESKFTKKLTFFSRSKNAFNINFIYSFALLLSAVSIVFTVIILMAFPVLTYDSYNFNNIRQRIFFSFSNNDISFFKDVFRGDQISNTDADKSHIIRSKNTTAPLSSTEKFQYIL